MTTAWHESPRTRALLGFIVGAGVGSLTGLLLFGDDPVEVAPPALGIGIGMAFAFYLVFPTERARSPR